MAKYCFTQQSTTRCDATMFYEYPEMVERFDKEKRLKKIDKSRFIAGKDFVYENICIVCGKGFFSSFKNTNVCDRHSLV
jgi:hypothetical protein